MPSTLLNKKKVENNSTFPSYSDEIGSSTDDSEVYSEGYTFSADVTTTSEDIETFVPPASLKKTSPKKYSSMYHANDDPSVVSTQSKSTVMSVLTSIDRALDAVVDIIIPVEKSITRTDMADAPSKIPLKKKPSIMQQLVSPKSTTRRQNPNSNHPSEQCLSPNSAGTVQKPPSIMAQLLSPRLASRNTDYINPPVEQRLSPRTSARKNSDCATPKISDADQRDDISSRSLNTQSRRDAENGTGILREGSERVSNLFDMKWMYNNNNEEGATAHEKDKNGQDKSISETYPVDQKDTSGKKKKYVVRRQGLVARKGRSNVAKSDRKLWNKTKTKNENQKQKEVKSSRSIFGRKKVSSAVKLKEEEVEEKEEDEGGTKDCAEWLVTSLCGKAQDEEPSTLTTTANKNKKKKWAWRRNRKNKKLQVSGDDPLNE